MTSSILKSHRSLLIGCGLLILAFAAGLFYIGSGVFIDEGAILASGWLMAKGYRLYTDVFTHQFPLPSYWASWVFVLLGHSFVAARISLLVLRLVVAALMMRLTGWYAPIGLSTLAWSLIGPFYFGHMLIYYAFSGIFLSASFIILLALLTKQIADSWLIAVVLGALSAAGFMADPQTAFSSILAVFVLLAQRHWRSALAIALLPTVTAAAAALAMWLNGTLSDFYVAAIRLNLDVYPRFCCSGGLTATQMLEVAASGLFNSRAVWMINPALFPFDQLPHLWAPVDQWLDTGVIYRAVVIFACVALCWERRWLAAGYVYAFAWLTLYRSEMFFRAIPFVLISIMLAGWMAARPAAPGVAKSSQVNTRWNRSTQIQAAIFWCVRAGSVFLLLWMGVRSVANIVVQGDRLSYAANYQGYEILASNIHHRTCNQPDVALAYFPGDPIVYFYTDMRPASRFLYVFPWTAQFQPELIEQLQGPPTLMYFDSKRAIWGIKDIDYAADLYQFLQKNYLSIGDDYYYSPSLAQICPRT